MPEDMKQFRESMYEYFDRKFPETGEVQDAALRYVMLNRGGKLGRPFITMSVATAYKTQADVRPHAAAIECIHRGSCVLDDMPSMDNSEIRHGQPSCWKKYGEATAQMIASLLMGTFPVQLTDESNANDSQKMRIREEYAEASKKLCRGQSLDLGRKQTNGQECLETFWLKTGSLYAASAVVGGILGNAPEEDIKRLRVFGSNSGVAYQILDDWQDRYGSVKDIGKPVGQDEHNQIVTLFQFWDSKRIREEIIHFKEEARTALRQCSMDLSTLERLIDSVIVIPEIRDENIK